MRIKYALSIITFIAISLAALILGSDSWRMVVYLAVVASYFAAALLARLDKGPAGSAWFGFALFGGGYLILAFGPWEYSVQKVQVPAEPFVVWTSNRLHPINTSLLRSGQAPGDYVPSLGRRVHNTAIICHLLLSWAFACLGAVTTRLFHRGRKRNSRHGWNAPASTPAEATD